MWNADGSVISGGTSQSGVVHMFMGDKLDQFDRKGDIKELTEGFLFFDYYNWH